jgi:hypothetical protein
VLTIHAVFPMLLLLTGSLEQFLLIHRQSKFQPHDELQSVTPVSCNSVWEKSGLIFFFTVPLPRLIQRDLTLLIAVAL